ncbi:hypothetical protein [Aeoliella sp. SH292]
MSQLDVSGILRFLEGCDRVAVVAAPEFKEYAGVLRGIPSTGRLRV